MLLCTLYILMCEGNGESFKSSFAFASHETETEDDDDVLWWTCDGRKVERRESATNSLWTSIKVRDLDVILHYFFMSVICHLQSPSSYPWYPCQILACHSATRKRNKRRFCFLSFLFLDRWRFQKVSKTCKQHDAYHFYFEYFYNNTNDNGKDDLLQGVTANMINLSPEELDVSIKQLSRLIQVPKGHTIRGWKIGVKMPQAAFCSGLYWTALFPF